MLKDLAGTAGLHEALIRTNELLADVLDELKRTNTVQLEAVVAELQSLRETMAVSR